MRAESALTGASILQNAPVGGLAAEGRARVKRANALVAPVWVEIMAPYRILTIDGGGIRGLLTTILLERLEAAVPGFLSRIDLFAGTSTGGILALGLASGVTPNAARALYEEKGPAVFQDSLFDNIRDLGHAIGAQYGNTNLKKALTDYFGDKTLGELPKKV